MYFSYGRARRRVKPVSAPAHPPPACPPRRKAEHLTGLWLANLSNSILCFTYVKAIFNTLLVRIGLKKESGFKVRRRQAAAVLVQCDALQESVRIRASVHLAACLSQQQCALCHSCSARGANKHITRCPQVTEKAGGEVNTAQQGMMGRVAAFSKRVGSALGRIGPQQPVLPVKVDAVKDKKKEEAKAKEKMVRNDKVVLLFVFQVGTLRGRVMLWELVANKLPWSRLQTPGT